eukprot:CAMPEP_0201883244 /NCGR_PEP_ID=MMETSP0902-20130614/15237_1 /ASSEMBLY_ACC=CAM_ASM_000551 /TAXON_ID=420261 /ORGANISM="Thalassiosira antarctica, Strain CCMP982" /LENGTH=70 /DNA_ID=CAMNT_0048411985 /DNA_START=111 /DNA_END=319 /DNA_ORIENTATION=-
MALIFTNYSTIGLMMTLNQVTSLPLLLMLLHYLPPLLPDFPHPPPPPDLPDFPLLQLDEELLLGVGGLGG